MLDLIQILLTIIVTTLTLLLAVIGIEVFKILKELKQTLERVNKILDDVETITNTVVKPVEGMSSLIAGIKQGAGVVKVLTKLFKENEGENNAGE